MTERIAESGQSGTNPQEAAEIARKKGMTKGTVVRQNLSCEILRASLPIIL